MRFLVPLQTRLLAKAATLCHSFKTNKTNILTNRFPCLHSAKLSSKTRNFRVDISPIESAI